MPQHVQGISEEMNKLQLQNTKVRRRHNSTVLWSLLYQELELEMQLNMMLLNANLKIDNLNYCSYLTVSDCSVYETLIFSGLISPNP